MTMDTPTCVHFQKGSCARSKTPRFCYFCIITKVKSYTYETSLKAKWDTQTYCRGVTIAHREGNENASHNGEDL